MAFNLYIYDALLSLSIVSTQTDTHPYTHQHNTIFYMDLQKQMRMRTNQPCAACRMLRRRCSDSCLLAPYFPAEETDNFIQVHKVFGASNIIKTLQVCIWFVQTCVTKTFKFFFFFFAVDYQISPFIELSLTWLERWQMLDESSREDAVKSMVYEAKARLRDPVYGCTRVICFLQKHVKDLEAQLEMTKEQFVESQAQRDQLLEIFMDANRFKSTAPINNEVFDRYDWIWDDNTFGCDVPFEYSTDLSDLYANVGFQDQHGQTSCST